MATRFAALVVLPLLQLASADPSPSFPFNAQLPPAARVDKFFSYSFSPHTFESGSKITYSLGNHPKWLSIESDNRRIYGTPDDADVPEGGVVGQPLDIVATDDTGSTSMNATLVVSRNTPPSVEIPLIEQIKSFGHFSAPSSILSYPSTGFKYAFNPDTFGSADNITYYAVSGNNSPLPAWVRFDTGSLTFTGKTPPFESLVQPPQTFDFNLVASDIVGFSAASIAFSIVVGSHKLTTANPIITLNATRGSEFTYNGLEDGVKLDNKAVDPGTLDVTTDDMPDWLSFDSDTRKLQGTPGKGDHATNFTIHFNDPFADTLDVVAVVNVATGLFQSTFEDMKIRPGGKFDVDLTSYFRDPSDVEVKVTMDPDENWLNVNGFKLSGTAPKSAKGGFNISVEASSKSSSMKETETFGVSFLAVDGTTVKSTDSASSSPTETPTPSETESGSSSDDSDSSHPGHLSTGQILLATIMPILFIALVLMLLLCFFRRRRARQTYLNSKYRSKISAPVANSLRINGSEVSVATTGNMTEVARVETHHMFKPDKVGYAEVASELSSGPRSSETLGGSSTPDFQQGLMTGARGRAGTIRTVSNPDTEDARQSWFTVERTNTIARSLKSHRSHRSDTTFPDSTHQSVPTGAFLSGAGDGTFRRGLELTIPSLEDLPSTHPPTSVMAYVPSKQAKPRRSVDDIYSTTTVSSAALTSLHGNKPRFGAATIMEQPPPFEAAAAPNSSRGANWVTVEESEAAESVSELRRPDLAHLSSQPPWLEGGSSNGSKVFSSDTSFGSSENWRVINSRHNAASVSYQDIVNEAPFNPSRPGTARDGARPGERATPEVSSSDNKWSAKMGPSASALSKMSDVGEGESEPTEGQGHGLGLGPNWARDDSGKFSEGSFSVFI